MLRVTKFLGDILPPNNVLQYIKITLYVMLTYKMLHTLHGSQLEDADHPSGARSGKDRAASFCVIAPGHRVEVLLRLKGQRYTVIINSHPQIYKTMHSSY